MLSAFQPRSIVELKARDKSKIESLLAHGDRLFVGLNTGSLRIYRVNDKDVTSQATSTSRPSTPDNATEKVSFADLLDERDKFSRRPVQQLAIVKEANILISLSDAYVSFHDLETFALTERLEKTKGATAFAVISNVVKDEATDIPSLVSRLAVAVKRKIIIWTWQDMELSPTAEELTLVGAVKSLNWASGTKIIAGMDAGYVMADIKSENLLDINRPLANTEAGIATGVRFGAVSSSGMGYMGMGAWVPRPMASKLSEGQMLLAKDVNTLFIDFDGNPIEKRQIPWSSAPEAIGYSYPYMLSLQQSQKGTLEVRNPETLSLLQSINLPNAAILHVPNPSISLAHAGKGFLVASDRCIWRMGALGYDSQIDQLASQRLFDEAISLITMLEDTLFLDKEARLRDIRLQKAHHLFNQRRFREALDLFSTANAPPKMVIALYPSIFSGSLTSTQEGTAENENVSITSPKQKTHSRNTSLKTGPESESSDNISSDQANGAESANKAPLEGKELSGAVRELMAYLAQTRTQLQKFIDYDGELKPYGNYNTNNPHESNEKPPFEYLVFQKDDEPVQDWQQSLLDTAILVDTTLFRAYMYALPGLAGSLFRLENFCDPEVVNEKLYENGRYNELIDFLHGKRRHREALELLEKLCDNSTDSGKDNIFRGPQRTVRYLQQLPFEMIDLILQYGEGPIRTDPDLGMQIFLADTENAETLPRRKVLDFLQGIESKLVLKYLEHIIEELSDKTPEFHDWLIRLYLDRIKGLEDDGTAPWQEKLEHFLRDSGQYDKIRTLKSLPTDNPKFYESRAIILGKLERHKDALIVRVFQQQDYIKAEEYCNAVYLSSVSSTPTSRPKLSSIASTSSARNLSSKSDPSPPIPHHTAIYTTLLSLYLSPPPPHAPNLPSALSLLSNHGSRLPAISTLDLLPSTLPVSDLEAYFRGRMRAEISLMREESILRALSAVGKDAATSALFLGEDSPVARALGTDENKDSAAGMGRNRRVLIGEERLCGVCHKRFGRSAVRVYPDGVVVHYGCGERADGAGRQLGGAKGRGWRGV